MAEKNDPPKSPPQPQNSGAPDKPKMPENRLVTGKRDVRDGSLTKKSS